jgi:ligand-binding sensor domain-containing protein
VKAINFLLILCLLAGSTLAQRPLSRDFWLNENNSPVRVNALATDRRGYLWLGTDAGLYRFNGINFVLQDDSLRKSVTAVVTRGDSVFCGYEDGRIMLHVNDMFIPVKADGPMPRSRINSLAFRKGCLWACTESDGAIAFIHGKSFELDSRVGLTDDDVYRLVVTSVTTALLATDRGLNLVSLDEAGKISVHQEAAKQLPDLIIRSLARTMDGSNCVWAGMQKGGILRKSFLKGTDGAPWEWTKEWEWGQVNDILPLSAERALAVTEDGYFVSCEHRPDGGFTLTPHLFEGKHFRCLKRDFCGNIWCGSTEGLTLITEGYIAALPAGRPYTLSGISAMVCDKNNHLYFSQDEVLYECPLLEPGKAKAVLQAGARITTLYADSQNNVWVGTLGAGLFKGRGNRFQEIKSVPKLLAGQILAISGMRNSLWVSSLNGVEELRFPTRPGDTVQIHHHGKHTGMGSDFVYQLFPDSHGAMWMATDGAGICRYQNGRYSHWDSAQGFNAKVVYSITEDPSGRIWTASLDQGLYGYSDGRWRNIGRDEGLVDPAISTVASNGTGQIIIVHTKGIDEWHPTTGQFRHYGRRLGLDIDSQSTALNCFAVDTSGNVWIPYEHGFLCFTQQSARDDLRPRISINEILLFFKKVPITTEEFHAGENHIGFHFEGINFANREKVFYRYRLIGFDSGWLPTTDESVTFPALPPGTYKFCVQASLSQDFTDAYTTEHSFGIEAPFWKRKWAIAAAILLLIGSAYGYLRLREQNLRRLSLLQRERMMAEYEQLRSQVNPHFLFNTLNTLTSLIEEDQEAAVQYTMQLSDLYRSMLAYKDQDLIYLTEELALLEKYMYIQQSRFRGGLHVHLNIPPDVRSGRKIIPLALQLLVENAIKHNIVSLTQPLHIFIQADESTITVRNTLQRKLSETSGAGVALVNITRRYALMNAGQVEYGIRGEQFIVSLPLL